MGEHGTPAGLRRLGAKCMMRNWSWFSTNLSLLSLGRHDPYCRTSSRPAAITTKAVATRTCT